MVPNDIYEAFWGAVKDNNVPLFKAMWETVSSRIPAYSMHSYLLKEIAPSMLDNLFVAAASDNLPMAERLWSLKADEISDKAVYKAVTSVDPSITPALWQFMKYDISNGALAKICDFASNANHLQLLDICSSVESYKLIVGGMYNIAMDAYGTLWPQSKEGINDCDSLDSENCNPAQVEDLQPQHNEL